MDITYSYMKQRKNFGAQPRFCEVSPYLIDSINPDTVMQKKYGLRNPIHAFTQTDINQSEHYVNTRRVILQDQGMKHDEGGWPRDVNCNDEEQALRYKRKIERDDAYINAILSTNEEIKHYIQQNNSIDMYNMYFQNILSESPVEKSLIRVNNVFRDTARRPISCIAWTNEDDAKLIVAYCDTMYPITRKQNQNDVCYIWDVEQAYEPSSEIEPTSDCWQIITSPVNPNVIIAGLGNGKVCIFDIRVSRYAVTCCADHLAHRDPVSALLFIHSRNNTEFFSGSFDGQCMWWDTRKLAEPTSQLIMAVTIPQGHDISLADAEGITALQFDRSFPTKFLCGTDTGLVINVNRKGKTHSEIISAIYNAHFGPVRAVHRNPSITKMFITCGDWCVRVWSEDIHTSPIVNGIRHRYQLSDVAWAPVRASGYMTTCADGIFRYWDILRSFEQPVNKLRLSKYPLVKVKPHEDGRLIAVGDLKGNIYLMSLSDSLVTSGARDKQIMVQAYERETKREHILETRIKEIRLKLKADEESASVPPLPEPDETLNIKVAEDAYKKLVTDEMRNLGITHSSVAKRQR